ncbi:MAG: DUF790 family protein [Crenarchaeota archaeon]|nr:DUF790 family protein [Thermoproteota archaeon]MCR8455582.1 DUF790 family protein [Thermoproteota archaeon]MCR8501533.1 DUF790 family protein [Thermoproteota archaeon]
MRFADENLSEKIIEIARNSASFADIYDKLMEQVPKRLIPAVMSALEIFYEERPVELPAEIKEAWRRYSGEFIRLGMLDDLIDRFCKEQGIDKQLFLAWFNGHKTLSQKANLEPKLLTGIINFLIVRRLLKRAVMVTLHFPKIEGGTLVKDVLFIARRLRADTHIEENEEIIAYIRASELSLEPMAAILGYCSKVKVMLQNGRKIIIQGTPIATAFKHKVFDSTFESIFYEALKKLGVSVRKDAPILIGDLVFIPDFEVTLGNRKVYIEIVGYYRVKYLINKEIKIRRASEMGIPLIVVARRESFEYLGHLANKVKFYWFSNKRELENIASDVVSFIGTS